MGLSDLCRSSRLQAWILNFTGECRSHFLSRFSGRLLEFVVVAAGVGTWVQALQARGCTLVHLKELLRVHYPEAEEVQVWALAHKKAQLMG